jgi:hypothetical protein
MRTAAPMHTVFRDIGRIIHVGHVPSKAPPDSAHTITAVQPLEADKRTSPTCAKSRAGSEHVRALAERSALHLLRHGSGAQACRRGSWFV